MHTNNVELIERINEKLDLANALGAVYSSVAWAYAGSFLNATLGLYSELNPDRIQRLERRIDELAQIAGWASSLALPDYRPTAEQLLERVGKPQEFINDEELIEAKVELSGMTKEELLEVHSVAEEVMAERAALQKKIYERHRQAIKSKLANALIAPMDASFDLPDRDARRIAKRLSEKAEDALQREKVQIALARRMDQLTRAVANKRLLEAVIPEIKALHSRLDHEIEAQTQRAPIEEQTAELTGTDDAHQTPKRWNKRKIA